MTQEIMKYEEQLSYAILCCNAQSPYDKSIYCDLPEGHDSFHWYRDIARWGTRNRKANEE
jgi:hypothetical protein